MYIHQQIFSIAFAWELLCPVLAASQSIVAVSPGRCFHNCMKDPCHPKALNGLEPVDLLPPPIFWKMYIGPYGTYIYTLKCIGPVFCTSRFWSWWSISFWNKRLSVIWGRYFFPSKWRSVHRKHRTWANKKTRSGSLRMIKSIQKKVTTKKVKQQMETTNNHSNKTTLPIWCNLLLFVAINTQIVSKFWVCHWQPAFQWTQLWAGNG